MYINFLHTKLNISTSVDVYFPVLNCVQAMTGELWPQTCITNVFLTAILWVPYKPRPSRSNGAMLRTSRSSSPVNTVSQVRLSPHTTKSLEGTKSLGHRLTMVQWLSFIQQYRTFRRQPLGGSRGVKKKANLLYRWRSSVRPCRSECLLFCLSTKLCTSTTQKNEWN